MSSGHYLYPTDEERYCGADDCEFEGLVVVWRDTETHSQGWDCPLCNYDHDEAFD